MPCIAVPHVSLASLGLSLPTIALPPIALPGLTLCCTLQLPPIPTYLVNQVIVLVTSLIPGLGKVLGPILAILMKAIAVVNSALDLISFRCPLGATT